MKEKCKMNEIIIFSVVLILGIVVFLAMSRKKVRSEAQPTQNYDDKIDRVVEQFDNL